MDAKFNYNSCVRLGNWYEDMLEEEEMINEFMEKKEKGELSMQKNVRILKFICTPYPRSVTRDGYVHFGDRISLFCKTNVDLRTPCVDTKPPIDVMLAMNYKDPLQVVLYQGMKGSCIVTGSRTLTTQIRSIFEVVCCEDSTHGAVLQYGQHFMLRTLPEVRQLYVKSDIMTLQRFARKSRHQEVTLEEEPSFLTHWQLVYPDHSYRMEMEGMPVKANQQAIIRHCKTGQNLCVEHDFHVRTFLDTNQK